MKEDTKAIVATEPTENGEEPQAQGVAQEGKTFTQEEVNEIVQRRLAREREKLAAESENSEAEKKLMEREKAVLHRELRADALERLKEDDLPAKLADLINCENAEDFSRTYKTVVAAFKEAVDAVPKVPERGGAPEPAQPRTDWFREAFRPKI